MQNTIRFVTPIFLVAGVASAQTTQPADVPVTAVKLFSSGVGYFERSGVVNGDDRTTLTFKAQQINDILKSLVLQDLDGGTAGVITYPSQDPIARTLAGFSVDVSANPSLQDLLTQLRGSPLTMTVGSDTVSGTLLGTETKHRSTGDDKARPIDVPVLNVMTNNGLIRAVPLDDVREIRLDDARLQKDLTDALATLAGARNQEQKPVQIDFHGKGQRHVHIGYVVESPVWKTSYRLILDKDKSNLQGWAMVENQTDSDWKDVQLSLISGRPISFIEDLYTPIYLARPTVLPNLGGVTLPPVDLSSIMTKAAAPMASARAQMQQMNSGNHGANLFSDSGGQPASETVSSMALTAALGELFSYGIDHVSLARHQSAMLPIVTDAVKTTRLSVYNQAVMGLHPLYGVRLENSTGKHLLQGPVTVFDHGSYAGDVQIDNLPPGQMRLLSYGIDLQTNVDADRDDVTNSVTAGKIVKGTLTITRRQVSSHHFKIDNKGDAVRTIVIEDPIRAGWTLVDTPKPYQTTADQNRFQIDVPAGQSNDFVVKQQFLDEQAIVILNGDEPTLAAMSSTGEIAANVRNALAKAAELKAAVATTTRQIGDIDTSLKSISDEQVRIRQNMQTIDRQSEYYNRLMKKMNDQETTIESSQAKKAELQKTLETELHDLENYLANLNVE